MTSKNKKRIIFFLILVSLTITLVILDDLVVKIIVGILQLLFLGFIIFLRDTIRSDSEFTETEKKLDSYYDSNKQSNFSDSGVFSTGDGEGFSIVKNDNSPNTSGKNVEDKFDERKFGSSSIISDETKKEYARITNLDYISELSREDEFKVLLKKLLKAIKDSLSVHSVVFFIYNPENETIILREYESNSSEIFPTKYDLSNDVISKIIKSVEPDNLSNMNTLAESDNLVYYRNPQGIKSFCGVPYEIGDGFILVLAIDSKAVDDFGSEHFYILGRFINIIASMLSLFNESQKDSNLEKKVSELIKLVGATPNYSSLQKFVHYLTESFSGLTEWNMMTLTLYDNNFNKAKIVSVRNKINSLKYIGENLEINLKETLIGETIIKGKEVVIKDFGAEKKKRFKIDEDISLDGSFLSVPIINNDQILGVVSYESLKKNQYQITDIDFIKKVSKILAFLLNNFYSQNFLKKITTLDYETLVLNKSEFKNQLEIALQKDEQLNIQGTLAILQVDESTEDSLFDTKSLPKVINLVGKILSDEISKINLIGRLNTKQFAVYFFNSNPSDTRIWAEQIKRKIATFDFPVIAQNKNHTVSIGITTTEKKLSFDSVVRDAELALNKAISEGGNKVVSTN